MAVVAAGAAGGCPNTKVDAVEGAVLVVFAPKVNPVTPEVEVVVVVVVLLSEVVSAAVEKAIPNGMDGAEADDAADGDGGGFLCALGGVAAAALLLLSNFLLSLVIPPCRLSKEKVVLDGAAVVVATPEVSVFVCSVVLEVEVVVDSVAPNGMPLNTGVVVTAFVVVVVSGMVKEGGPKDILADRSLFPFPSSGPTFTSNFFGSLATTKNKKYIM